MDNNVLWGIEKTAQRVIEGLNRNNIDGFYVEDEIGAVNKVKELIKEGSTVGCGGSMTLFETGIIDLLRNGKYNFLDRYKEGLTPDDIKKLYKESFFADTYFLSANAITLNGEIYNVDGNGNRVAAMIYGPDQVIIIAGMNKIVNDLNEAENRLKNIAGPVNMKRINRNTPCTKTGYCMNCRTSERGCDFYVVVGHQQKRGRINVILVGKSFGY